MAIGFLVPVVLADPLELQRDVYYAVYVAAVAALFGGWARDTGQSVRAMVARHPRATRAPPPCSARPSPGSASSSR